MRQHQLIKLVDKLVFGEGPRWHNDALWFSDIKDHGVKRLSADGKVETIVEIDGEPSGLGWLPSGELLIVSMLEHSLLKFDNGKLSLVANFSEHCGGKANDMVVDQYGHAFIGNMGFDVEAEPMVPAPTQLVRVDLDGSVHVAATDVWCPNGMGITPDGSTLLVAQSASTEMLGFDLAVDGSLSNRHVYTTLPEGATYDGICVDSEGAIWAANPVGHEFLRAMPGGEITDRVDVGDMHAIACMLGGEDRKTLYCIINETNSLAVAEKTRGGTIGVVQVDIAGAGWP